MQQTSTKRYIRISKEEYVKLKTLARRFGAFWNYFKHLKDVEEARSQVKKKKVISQRKLFRELGL